MTTMRKLMWILVVASCLIGPLNANDLTYTITPTGGQFSYQFTLTNTGTTGGTLFDLFLSLATDISNIDTAAIGTPVGWGDPTGGVLFFGPDVSPSTSFIEWGADFSGLYDVAISSSLSGFSFTATQPVDVPITFALNGTTDFAPAQEVSGAPEPTTFILLLPLLAAMGWRFRFGSVGIRCRRPRSPFPGF
jgi:hypothetical protein